MQLKLKRELVFCKRYSKLNNDTFTTVRWPDSVYPLGSISVGQIDKKMVAWIEKVYLDDGGIPKELQNFFGRRTIAILIETLENLDEGKNLWDEFKKACTCQRRNRCKMRTR